MFTGQMTSANVRQMMQQEWLKTEIIVEKDHTSRQSSEQRMMMNDEDEYN